MKCPNCGSENDSNSRFCNNCGSELNNLNNANTQTNNVNKKESVIGWGFLGFIIPIVGIILFFVWKKSNPRKSKASGIGALISIVIGIVATVVLVAITAALIGNANRITEAANQYSSSVVSQSSASKTNTSNNKIADISGYWIDNTNNTVLSIEQGSSVASNQIYFSMLSNEVMKICPITYDGSYIKTSNEKIPYTYSNNTLKFMLDGKTYTFTKTTKDKYDQLGKSVSQQITNSTNTSSNNTNTIANTTANTSTNTMTNTTSSNTTTSTSSNTSYDARILGKWTSEDKTITMNFTNNGGSLGVTCSTKDGSPYFASVTMDSNKIEVYNHYTYTYRFTDNKLELTNTSNNQTVTFTK